MRILKFAIYSLLILFILSPFFIGDTGLDPEEYARDLEIEGGDFVEVDGYKTFYIDLNSDSEKTVLFLHGFGGSATNWLPVIPSFLENDYRVVAVDLKGFGFSQKDQTQDFSHPGQVEFLNSFSQKLNLENITLVGHSMGGNIATMYSQEYSENIDRLVLVSPALLEEGEEDVLRNNALKVLDWPIVREYVRIVLKYSLNEERIHDIFNSAMHNSESVDLDENVFVDTTKFLGWEYVTIKIASNSYRNTLQEDVSDMEIPVTIIWGEEDTWTPFINGEYVSSKFQKSDLKSIEDVGHLPMIESPEKFIKNFDL